MDCCPSALCPYLILLLSCSEFVIPYKVSSYSVHNIIKAWAWSSLADQQVCVIIHFNMSAVLCCFESAGKLGCKNEKS